MLIGFLTQKYEAQSKQMKAVSGKTAAAATQGDSGDMTTEGSRR